MNINLIAAIDGSGYGIVGLNVLKAFVATGHEVAFFPRHVRREQLTLALDETALLMRCLRRQRTFDTDAPCLRISAEDDMTLFAGRGPRCGLAFIDTTGLTEVERRHLGTLDRVFVASKWGRTVAIDNGLDPGTVVAAPMGVDRDVFAPSSLREGGPTVFLNAGSWQRRKGHDVLIEAFGLAFRPDDDVELRLLSRNPWSRIAEERMIAACRESPMAEHISVLPRVPAHAGVAELMRDADCGIFPARSEAWNLEALEMLSCGRPIIATNYSGHTEYLDRENALLIEIDELEPAVDPVWMPVFGTRKIGDWARLGPNQVEQLVEHMRTVHRQKQSGTLSLNRAGIATAERFTWERAANRLVEGMP